MHVVQDPDHVFVDGELDESMIDYPFGSFSNSSSNQKVGAWMIFRKLPFVPLPSIRSSHIYVI